MNGGVLVKGPVVVLHNHLSSAASLCWQVQYVSLQVVY